MMFLLQCFTWLPNVVFLYVFKFSHSYGVCVIYLELGSRTIVRTIVEDYTEALLGSYLGCWFLRHCSHWFVLLIYQKQNEVLDGLHVIFMDLWMFMAKSHCKSYPNLLNYALHGLHSEKRITRVCYLDSIKWSNMELNYSLSSLELDWDLQRNHKELSTIKCLLIFLLLKPSLLRLLCRTESTKWGNYIWKIITGKALKKTLHRFSFVYKVLSWFLSMLWLIAKWVIRVTCYHFLPYYQMFWRWQWCSVPSNSLGLVYWLFISWGFNDFMLPWPGGLSLIWAEQNYRVSRSPLFKVSSQPWVNVLSIDAVFS